MHLNIEIKAIAHDPVKIREYLKKAEASFKGTDHQTDTYFNVHKGRLKLRQGNIEYNLIYYERENIQGAKSSDFSLVKVADGEALKATLTRALGVMKVIEKNREIYYIDNVKFHIDQVEGLGSFVEIEAGNLLDPTKLREDLQQQCDFYISALEINADDMLTHSYSDML